MPNWFHVISKRRTWMGHLFISSEYAPSLAVSLCSSEHMPSLVVSPCESMYSEVGS